MVGGRDRMGLSVSRQRGPRKGQAQATPILPATYSSSTAPATSSGPIDIFLAVAATRRNPPRARFPGTHGDGPERFGDERGWSGRVARRH